jgi:hypothetical protein
LNFCCSFLLIYSFIFVVFLFAVQRRKATFEGGKEKGKTGEETSKTREKGAQAREGEGEREEQA